MDFISGCLLWYSVATTIERRQRRSVYAQALARARSLGKPLLVAGGAKGSHGTGDLCVDLNAASCRGAPSFMQADIRAIPLPDKWAGVIYASHVLEHMPTVADAETALREFHRVADYVYIVSPHKWNPMAWLHPDHYLWVSCDRDGVHFEQGKWR